MLFGAIIISVPGLGFKMLHHEPCIYFSESKGSLIIHHIDDGRIGAESEDIRAITSWMAQYLLLKLSGEIGLNDGYKYLNRIRIRLEDGWATLADPST